MANEETSSSAAGRWVVVAASTPDNLSGPLCASAHRGWAARKNWPVATDRRSSRPRTRPHRATAAVYRRRRLAAVAGLAVLILLFALAVRANDGAPPGLTPRQAELLERASEPVRFTVSASGDILIHTALWEQALANGGGDYDFAPMFGELREFVAEADLGLCHLETPLGPPPPASYPVFSTPTELAAGIRASGWDACSTASNHSLDQGVEGIEQTGAALDQQRIEHTGSFVSAREQRRPLVVEVDGVEVGLLAYTDMTNGIPLPEPWSVNLAAVDDPADRKAEQILAAAKRLRRAGAEAVILNMHWGDENAFEPNQSQRDLAEALTRSPLITAIVGQGPHVPGPIERVNRKFVVFSEGNLVSNQSALAGLAAETQYGFVALLRMVADGRGCVCSGSTTRRPGSTSTTTRWCRSRPVSSATPPTPRRCAPPTTRRRDRRPRPGIGRSRPGRPADRVQPPRTSRRHPS